MSTAAAREQQVGVVLSLLTRLTPRQSLAAAGLALVATVAAYVYMAGKGMNTEGLLIFACPVIATLAQQAGVNHVTAAQNAVLDAQPTTADLEDVVRRVIREELPVVVEAVLATATPGIPHQRTEIRAEAHSEPRHAAELEAVS